MCECKHELYKARVNKVEELPLRFVADQQLIPQPKQFRRCKAEDEFFANWCDEYSIAGLHVVGTQP